jgi:tetratricopeptide (TPR) repeat protein
MKKVITIFALALSINATLESCSSSMAQGKSALLARVDTAGHSTEWQTITALHAEYAKALQLDSNDYATQIKMIELYLNEARITGNTSHYNFLATQMLDKIIAAHNAAPNYLYLAYCYKATVLLSLHQFQAAKTFSEKALALNPYEADNYGTLIDASIELGDYKAAVAYCDKMLSIRPDLRSYSRASYIREIYGDNNGAIEAMTMAVRAGAAGRENTEWARVQLGNLYFNKGVFDTAQLMYQTALAYRPNYVNALIGLAKIDEAANRLDSAIAKTEQAIGILSESSFVSYLGQLHAKNNNAKEANTINAEVVRLLETTEKENQAEKVIPHNGNRELAQAYLQNNQLDKAYSYAKKDLILRPDNIDANALLAEICFKADKITEAQQYANKAFVTGKKHRPTLEVLMAIYATANDKSNLAAVDKAFNTI